VLVLLLGIDVPDDRCPTERTNAQCILASERNASTAIAEHEHEHEGYGNLLLRVRWQTGYTFNLIAWVLKTWEQ
jgi:hypothetical protein